ncbi:MAG: dienelactone hydrolase family protein [Janthinobacterium lividum]
MTIGITRRAGLAAALLLGLPRLARAQDADGVQAGEAQIPTDGAAVPGIFAKPPGAGPFPIVLVAENGTELDRVVIDACHGLAKEGFIAVAPALFAGDPPDGTLMQRLDAAAAWAAQNGGDRLRTGIVGFGPGGRVAWIYDAFSPALKAAVAWYGPLQGTISPAHPMTALDAAGRLNAPLLGLYGKNDGTPQRLLLDAEARAKKAGKTAEIVSYVGAGRDFALPGASFDQAATLDGWQRTIKWLRDHGVA